MRLQSALERRVTRSSDGDGLRRVGRRVVTTIVVAVVAAPAITGRDSYPLSTYPVYAGARPQVADLATAVAVGTDGTRLRLPLPVIGASDDPLIVEERVADAIRRNQANDLCRSIAQRARNPTLTAIEVVTERVDLVQTAARGAPPLERIVHARCPVGP